MVSQGMKTLEANFDGLVGPTHNYAGLSPGNVASAANAQQPSNPKAAALQGLAKMEALAKLGIPQGVLPPHERPHLPTLRALGLSGDDAQVLAQARASAPGVLAAAASASAMWVANAATVSAGSEAADGRVHFTPANLCANLHRAIEPAVTGRLLKAVFPDAQRFAHHPPLPGEPKLGDEGAANHTRLGRFGERGIELYVYGRGEPGDPLPRRHPARQTRAASQAVARRHSVDPARCLFAQQDPESIDAGVFHNDVIAVGSGTVLLHHERAFLDTRALHGFVRAHVPDCAIVVVPAAELSLEEAVATYLFNSQLVQRPDGGVTLVAAEECHEHARARACLERIVADRGNPIDRIAWFDLRQSMRNGGGPACLRLRVVLDEAQRAAVNPACWIDAATLARLRAWVNRHYRDRLTFDDLADPQLLDESRTALDALSKLLQLGTPYDFQRD